MEAEDIRLRNCDGTFASRSEEKARSREEKMSEAARATYTKTLIKMRLLKVSDFKKEKSGRGRPYEI